jgi:stearoyl-CoA desaturase (delta-9 desaturase)
MCFLVLLVGYAITITITSVGYHRGLTHGAVTLHPWVRTALMRYGMWITGIDAKAWVCMHRLHHQHSDTEQDPHSPRFVGLWGIFGAQLKGYVHSLESLRAQKEPHHSLGEGLELSWLQQKDWRWPLVYVLHFGVAGLVGVQFGWLMALALFMGFSSHVVQGALINALGHAIGRRNFDVDDNSRNNTFAAMLCLGEGYQNNHHRFPASARFSYLPSEVDLGYGLCRAFAALGLLRIEEATLAPRQSDARVGDSVAGAIAADVSDRVAVR